MPTLMANQLEEIGTLLFERAGVLPQTARRVTASLVASNKAGHDSHGIVAAVGYIKKVLAGDLNPNVEPSIVNESPSTALVDARFGFGKIAADFAMGVLINKTRSERVAAVGIRNCFHIGRLAQYVEQAVEEGIIAMVTLCGGGSGTSTTAFGGAGRTLGTNPYAFGIPAGAQPPLIVDFATTDVAGGKIALARDSGRPIPEGWVVKKDGSPTTDPRDFFEGGMLVTMAGYKGLGLSMVAEALGGALTGATWFRTNDNPGNNVFMWGIRTDIFIPAREFAEREDASIAKVRATPPAEGFDHVPIPGDRSRQTRAEREKSGIEIPNRTWADIRELAESLGVADRVDSLCNTA